MRNIQNAIFKYSTILQQIKIPVIDTTNFLSNRGNFNEDCKQIVDSLHKYGCVIIKDPRVKQDENEIFLNMMERYFESTGHKFYQGQNIEEIFPDKYYQVGATPEYTGKSREHKDQIDQYTIENKALTPHPPPFDAKWRYLWQMGDSHQKSEFIHDNVTPEGYPDWHQNMDTWGAMMVEGCFTVTEMAAVGMDLPRDAFSRLLKGGHHVLAPTGSDLIRYDVSTIFVGYHYDLNFLSIHGRSRYPGLFVWLRTGERVSVAVPDGHLLLQAGKQFEILTAGYITCGFHEVVYTEAVKQKLNKAKVDGNSTWRVSSTLFSLINDDQQLRPLYHFNTQENSLQYPEIRAHDQVQQELKAIKLRKD